MRAALVLAALCAAAATAWAQTAIAPFSGAAPGTTLPDGWSERHVQRAPSPQYALVDDGGTTVLESTSERAAGAAVHPASIDAQATPWLGWRWKVDRVVSKARLEEREGDDFAARVYVFFDMPLDALPFAERWKIRLARLIYGDSVPAAALCYVWDNTHPPGTTVWNAYTDRVRMIVLESGEAKAGQWVKERRDVVADFRAAFGAQYSGPVPAVTGIGVGNDTDQTGERVVARFGDLLFEAPR
ncbi:MAG TPA: DUF3047 domain-containing protein [Usitatibacter sp.]|nr:DUF3047 domain-containing protein [Usitatibacter sp.]